MPFFPGIVLPLAITLAGPSTPGVPESEPKRTTTGVFCKLQGPELRERSEQIRRELAVGVLRVDSLAAGYRFWYAKSAERLALLAEFLVAESECCSFARFEIAIEPDSSEVSLTLEGPDGTRELFEPLAEELSGSVER